MAIPNFNNGDLMGDIRVNILNPLVSTVNVHEDTIEQLSTTTDGSLTHATVVGNTLTLHKNDTSTFDVELPVAAQDGASAYEVWVSQGNVGTEQDFLDSLKGSNGESSYQSWINVGNVGTEQDFLDSLRGDSGESAYQLWVSQGNTGSKDDFINSLKGDTGYSAYQVWLAQGNSGSLNDYLDSLKGERGSQGLTGERGDPFKIVKSYDSLLDMEADFSGSDVQVYDFVIISTPNTNDPDNSKLYMKEPLSWAYITDLSDAVGIAGQDGKSAYDLAVETGFSGSSQDWLDSLKGSEGLNGISAYEEWVVAGNNGTKEEFLESLKGDTGSNGESAYDLWKDQGNTGTESEFISSLQGKDAYQDWVDLGNTGTREDFVNYLKEQITFNGSDIKNLILDNDSGISGSVEGDNVTLKSVLIRDSITDSSSSAPPVGSSPSVSVRSFKYHPLMPEVLMVETGGASRIIDTLPHGTTYSISPRGHGTGVSMEGSSYSFSHAAGANPVVDTYKTIPLYILQPDSFFGVRDQIGYLSYPSDVEIDISSGFYLTTLISGYYAGNTTGTSFAFIGSSQSSWAGGGIGISFRDDGCYATIGNGSVLLEPSFTYNANSGVPTFYRVALYQEPSGQLHISVRSCLTGSVFQTSISASVLSGSNKVWLGCDRSGSTTTVAIGNTSLWIPDHDDDVRSINYRG